MKHTSGVTPYMIITDETKHKLLEECTIRKHFSPDDVRYLLHKIEDGQAEINTLCHEIELLELELNGRQ